ncbi:MAG: NAD+ synthase [Chloroflexi bacterium]|nr:NAD+ synthase [Chloroflexota bacterium]
MIPQVDLRINPDVARRVLTGFIRSEVARAGFKRVVLGLSGGIDSAVACYLAAEALGPENVLALRLPYKTSSPDSLPLAQLVIDATGVQSKTIDITPMVDAFFKDTPDMDKIRRGNVMARARMIAWYDQSAAFNALVLGTSNKTEILLGYTTIYGDNASAINPNGDLYKTQLRQLAKALGVPQVIQDKAPSADLWPGQTTEGELGFTYEEVDSLLYLLVDRRYSPEECVASGFKRDFVETVLERVRRNQFKRMTPLVAKVSNRTVGYDFLYLRDWGT